VISPSNAYDPGYIPGAEALKAVAQLGTKLKKENPELIYLLDRASLAFSAIKFVH
jgi:hypothetical protein